MPWEFGDAFGTYIPKHLLRNTIHSDVHTKSFLCKTVEWSVKMNFCGSLSMCAQV